MDATHQTLLRLYDEPLPVGLPPQPPDEAELLALMETKAWLDARAPRAVRPDAFALDAIFRAAAHGSPDGEVLPGVRHDRAPLRRPNRFHRAWAFAGSVGALATIAALVFTVVLPPPVSVVTTVGAAAPSAPIAVASVPVGDAPASASLAALPVPPPVAAAAPSAPSKSATSEAAAKPPVSKAAPAPSAAAVRSATARQSATSVPASALLADDDAAIASAQARAARLRARLDSALWDAPPVAPSMGAPAGASGAAARRFTQASHQ